MELFAKRIDKFLLLFVFAERYIAWKVSKSKYGVFSGPYFPAYGEILCISLYSVRMRENTDQKKLGIWTLLTQLYINDFWQGHKYVSAIDLSLILNPTRKCDIAQCFGYCCSVSFLLLVNYWCLWNMLAKYCYFSF